MTKLPDVVKCLPEECPCPADCLNHSIAQRATLAGPPRNQLKILEGSGRRILSAAEIDELKKYCFALKPRPISQCDD